MSTFITCVRKDCCIILLLHTTCAWNYFVGLPAVIYITFARKYFAESLTMIYFVDFAAGICMTGDWKSIVDLYVLPNVPCRVGHVFYITCARKLLVDLQSWCTKRDHLCSLCRHLDCPEVIRSSCLSSAMLRLVRDTRTQQTAAEPSLIFTNTRYNGVMSLPVLDYRVFLAARCPPLPWLPTPPSLSRLPERLPVSPVVDFT